ncbi:MAG: DPP IV N-terminal domain-containing protein [Chlamydiota bacterium]
MDRVLILLIAVMAATAGCGRGGGEEKAHAAPPAMEGRLVYQRGEGNAAEIWVMDLPSRKSVRLTDNRALDEYPRWSPDGREIAFYSDREGTRQIYIMDASGGNARRITGKASVNEDPSWSPDGSRLCFWAQDRRGAPENICLIARDGTGMTDITRSKTGSRRVPAWSPDGKRIAFTSDRYLSHQVYLIDASGAHEERLTGNPRGACRPRWSPDGKRIAYSDGGYGVRTNIDIWEMDPDGRNKKRLTEAGGHDYDPAYAPDGSRIIFASDRTGRYELYVMDRDGSNQARLTEFGDYARYPDWAR